MRGLILALLLVLPCVVLAADGDKVGPNRSQTPNYFIICFYMCDSATGDGACATLTNQNPENSDEWYFFVSEDEGTVNYVIDIENFFEVDDDPTVIGTLTDENPEFRWLRMHDGNLHKSLRANITTSGSPTDLDVQVCFIRYIHQ